MLHCGIKTIQNETVNFFTSYIYEYIPKKYTKFDAKKEMKKLVFEKNTFDADPFIIALES